MKWRSSQLIGAMMLLTSFGVLAAELDSSNPLEITLMTIRAQTEQLRVMGEAKDLYRFPAKAAYFRTIGDIDNSTKWAERCIADPAVAQRSKPDVMFLCMSLLAGNQLANGDVSSWADTMMKVRSVYNNSIAKNLSLDEVTFEINKPEFQRFLNWPSLSYTKKSESLTVPIKNIGGFSVINIKIKDGVDGKKRDVGVDFIIDTGSSRSILSPRAAHAMGLLVTDGFQFEPSDPLRKVKFSLASPVDLEIAGTTIKNASFSVTDNIDLNLIGFDILSKISPVVISKNYLKILPVSAPRTCAERLVTTSNLWGGYWGVRMKSTINGKEVLPLIDTGLTEGFQQKGDYHPAVGEIENSKKVVGLLGVQDIKYVERKANISIGEFNGLSDVQINNQRSAVFPVSWNVGNKFLVNYELYLDARAGYACLWNRGGAGLIN